MLAGVINGESSGELPFVRVSGTIIRRLISLICRLGREGGGEVKQQ